MVDATIPLKLQVGEKVFTVRPETLVAESGHFRELFSRAVRNPLEESNGNQGNLELFEDRDGEIFEHILRYIRNKAFPLF